MTCPPPPVASGPLAGRRSSSNKSSFWRCMRFSLSVPVRCRSYHDQHPQDGELAEEEVEKWPELTAPVRPPRPRPSSCDHSRLNCPPAQPEVFEREICSHSSCRKKIRKSSSRSFKVVTPPWPPPAFSPATRTLTAPPSTSLRRRILPLIHPTWPDDLLPVLGVLLLEMRDPLRRRDRSRRRPVRLFIRSRKTVRW